MTARSRLRIPSKTALYLSLTVAVTLYFGIVSLMHAFSSPYIVQDDARQAIVWFERLFDSSLFPQDYIADYALEGYSTYPGVKWIYELCVLAHIRPLILAKCIPLILGLFTSVFYFRFCFSIIPSGLCAFLSTVILSQNIWTNDNLSSGTPRAFLYPIFAGFLYYLVQKKFFHCLVFTALQAAFYPPFVLVCLCILGVRCIDFSQRPIPLSRDRSVYVWAIASLGVALLILFPILTHSSSVYGAVVTRQQMLSMPEFAPHGRTPFFIDDPLAFWFGGTSGLKPPVYPFAIWLAYLLPFLLRRKKKHNLLFDSVNLSILTQVIAAALILFFAAHLFLFKLYWPSRYPYHALPFVFSLSAGIVITLVFSKFQKLLKDGHFFTLKLWHQVSNAFLPLLLVLMLGVPFIPSIFLGYQDWSIGNSPELYRFVAQKSKSTLIAGLGLETSNIPSFSLRSVLFSQELAISFHVKYYQEIRKRIIQVLTAQYSADPKDLQTVIQNYGIDYWLLDHNALEPQYLTRKGNDWLLQYQPQTDQARLSLEKGINPAIARMIEPCSVLKTDRVTLLESSCILRQSSKAKQRQGVQSTAIISSP
jgi:hypothetical protein